MAKVVCVHGAFHELWGPHQVAARWVPALRDGLALHGGDLEPRDVAVAFYGDLFRPEPGRRLDDTKLEAIARRTGILDAAEQLLGVGGDDVLAQLVAKIGHEQVERTISQLGMYFADEHIRAEVQDRIRREVRGDTCVVVAHSLGTVVAYEVLAKLDRMSPIDLITVGSPLNRRPVIEADLQPPLAGGVGQWPPPVERWTNIAATGDPVVGDRPLSATFPGVVDVAVDNGHRAHDPEPYLCSAACGAALSHALGLEKPR